MTSSDMQDAPAGAAMPSAQRTASGIAPDVPGLDDGIRKMHSQMKYIVETEYADFFDYTDVAAILGPT